MPDHTPAPWLIQIWEDEPAKTQSRITIEGTVNEFGFLENVALIADQTPSAKANTYLIVAAPKMLAKLKELCGDCDRPWTQERWAAVLALINEAEKGEVEDDTTGAEPDTELSDHGGGEGP